MCVSLVTVGCFRPTDVMSCIDRPGRDFVKFCSCDEQLNWRRLRCGILLAGPRKPRNTVRSEFEQNCNQGSLQFVILFPNGAFVCVCVALSQDAVAVRALRIDPQAGRALSCSGGQIYVFLHEPEMYILRHQSPFFGNHGYGLDSDVTTRQLVGNAPYGPAKPVEIDRSVCPCT